MRVRTYIISFFAFIIINGCSRPNVNKVDKSFSIEDFDYLTDLVGTRYPFLEFKHINWDSLVKLYRPLVIANRGNEVISIFNRLLAELRDGHIEIRTKDGFPLITYKPPRFRNQKLYDPSIVRKYIEKVSQTANGKIEYGIIQDNIGYIHLPDFHEGDWILEFNDVLEYLKETDGIIIDVRNNPGGDGNQVHFIISRFTSVPLGYSVYLAGGIKQPQFLLFKSGPFQYLKPVIVLINGGSFSAAELFAVLMKKIPTVTTVGDTTGGGGGCNETFNLPTGKRMKIPTQYFTNLNMNMVEWNGVSPDSFVQQTESDIDKGKDRQLEFAIELLQRQSKFVAPD